MLCRNHWTSTLLLSAVLIAVVSACGGGDRTDGPSRTGEPPLSLNGAGATFPYPVYSAWAYIYGRLKNVQINYQSIGSGGGIAQIKAGTVDFGASDAALSGTELDSDGLVQFPMVIGGVVPVIHLQGIASGQVKLTPEALAGIYLGTITKWNDPKIASENEALNLPDKPITVVRRSDGSGTTWIFTTWLTAVSEEWRSRVGAGKAVEWPAGVGGKGNEGVANYVQQIDGAIGYVEYAYAIQNRMNVAQLRNRDGQFVTPNADAFQAAAANANWASAPGFGVVLVDQPGAATWPITGATFILMHREQTDARKAAALLDFFAWCYTEGAQEAAKLDYVPLPPNVVTMVQESWTVFRANGQSIATGAAR